MLLTRLSLTHFRNYRQLDLEFGHRLTLLQGRNAQGKTNLLEAIYFLATSKPVHAGVEREVVDWLAADEPIPYSRVAAQVQTPVDHGARTVELEILLTPRGDGLNYSKQVRINGVNKRSLDLIGQLRAVLFLPEDVKLVDGSPGERRRYLDMALCQIDPAYTHALASYQKIVTRRNSLLKTLRDQGANPAAASTAAQMGFWDDKLVQTGSTVLAKRHAFVTQLQPLAQARQAELSQGRETLHLELIPSFNYSEWPDAEFSLWQDGHLLDDHQWPWPGADDAASIAERFQAKLEARRGRELAAGMTLYGPHRDDLRFLVNGRDLRTFGSRGQQRSGALSLKLAEVQAMTDATGHAPLLLLDDVMSELDAQRRSTLLTVLDGVEQAVITTTDWDDFTPAFQARAKRLHVCDGTVSPATDSADDSADADEATTDETTTDETATENIQP